MVTAVFYFNCNVQPNIICEEELHTVGLHFPSLAAYSVWATDYVKGYMQ